MDDLIKSSEMKQKTLFELGTEGRTIMTEIFNGHEIRFSDIGGVRHTPLLDLYKAAGISRAVASKVAARIKKNFPDCIHVSKRETWGENAPNLKNLDIITLNGRGVSHFFSEIHTEKIADERTRNNIRELQSWVASLVDGMISGETEKATSNLLDHAYDKVDIRVTPVGDVLEQHLKVARLLAESRNADPIIMSEVAMFETEKHTGVSLDAYRKYLPTVDMSDVGLLTPTMIANRCDYTSAQQVNKLLAMMGLQEKNGKDWKPVGEGCNLALAYPYTNGKHSGYQLKWKEEIVSRIQRYERSHPELF